MLANYFGGSCASFKSIPQKDETYLGFQSIDLLLGEICYEKLRIIRCTRKYSNAVNAITMNTNKVQTDAVTR